MKAFNRHIEQNKRYEIQKTFLPRIAALPINQTEFCETYGFDETVLSRHLNGVNLAGQEMIDRYEKAISTEEKLAALKRNS